MSVTFPENPVLFGCDPRTGIVAAEMAGDNRVAVYLRIGQGITVEEDGFRPFVILEQPTLLTGWDGPVEFEPLEGSGDYRSLAVFPGWRALESAVKHLVKATGQTRAARGAPFLLVSDPVQQYLSFSGRTLFKGMRFEQVVRLQLDIETTATPGYEFPNAQREGDRITLISVSDSEGWEASIRSDRRSEADMLNELGELIRERDPDVIEGHNIFNFDLPYIAARAARHRVPLRWGRNGSIIRQRPSRFSVAERIFNYQRFDIYGRHVVDTLFLTQLYDVGTRELEGFGLKQVARYLGIASPNRVYIDYRDLPGLAEKDMERLVSYGLDDVRETREISRILGQSFFYQTQMFPLSHQNTVSRGNATRIDALLLREYLQRRRSIPKPPERESFQGGYADLFKTGVVSPIVHCDVQSLYPSILLAFGIGSSRDSLGVFPLLLRDLTERRIAAKRSAAAAEVETERRFFGVLQSTLKVLINSFYGYLGFAQGHFADFESASRVTAEGRKLIKRILDELRSLGATPVEVDTDGVYFIPPAGIHDESKERELVEIVSQVLPEGIRLEFSGRYRSMFSYKMKNYVLLSYDGKVKIRGSGLKSRGMEKFQRLLLQEILHAALEGRFEKIRTARDLLIDDIVHHRWTLDLFAKVETLHDSLAVYREKRNTNSRNTSAAYELALASGRPFQPGDQITYYVSGRGKNAKVFQAARFASDWDPTNPDENTEYYVKKVEDLYKRFLPLLTSGGKGKAGTLKLEF